MGKIHLGLLALALISTQAAHAAPASSKKPWGAVAYSSTTGAFGYAVDRPSQRAAETEAFRLCGSDCDVIKSFRNGCGAIADAERHFAWDTGASREIAEMKARKKCGGSSCKTAVWACTGGK
jgi:serine/threonine-protein kinase